MVRAKKLALVLIALTLLKNISVASLYAQPGIGDRALRLSNSNPSATATAYDFTLTYSTATNVGSVVIEFCTNTPIYGDVCTPTSTHDITAASLQSQTGEVGFSLDTINSTSNRLVLTRPASLVTPQTSRYVFSNIQNPSTIGTYYIRLTTHASTDGSGLPNEIGGIAYSIENGLGLSTEVPPFLETCAAVTINGGSCSGASGDFVELGYLSHTKTSTGAVNVLVSTNAGFGYSLSALGTTMTSGNNIIDNLTTPQTSAVGTSQFGINLRNNSSPDIGAEPTGTGSAQPTADYNQPNKFKFVSGDMIASDTGADVYRKFTVSYLVNVPKSQPAGVYSTSITFVALASF